MRLALEVGPRRGNVPTWACWVFVTYVNAHEISSRDKLSESGHIQVVGGKRFKYFK